MNESHVPEMPQGGAEIKTNHDSSQVVEGAWGELLRDKVFDYVEAVEKGSTAEPLTLTITAEDIQKLIEMEKAGTLPDWAGKNQEKYVEELEEMVGLES